MLDKGRPRLAISPKACNLLGRWTIQSREMNDLGLGVVILAHELTGRPDSDAVDATLAASGDASAFERLYRHHVPRVYSLVRRMLNDDDADELTQDIFVRAWQKLGTFRGEAAFGTWLHRVAVTSSWLGGRHWEPDESDTWRATRRWKRSRLAGPGQSWQWTSNRPWSACRTAREKCSCCMMSRATGTRKSQRCWDWLPGLPSPNCIGPAWPCAGTSSVRKGER